MDRKEKAVEFHHKGYDCAQAVACAFSDVLDMDETMIFRAMEGFGFGMGAGKCTCGAISGAVMTLSLLSSKGYQEGHLSKPETYARCSRMVDAFTSLHHGFHMCSDLKGKECSCDQYIMDAVECVEKML